MAKLQNISGLLVAINSDYTKDVVVTTKTTRAELTKMLQATEYALTEVLPRMEGYSSKVEELAKEKEALEENKEFVRINNVETLAQVFTDIRYTKKDCEAMSQGFLEALKQQGFI